MSKPIEACDCSQGAKNVKNFGGHLGCGGMARPKLGILGSMFDSDGNPNGIILGTDVLSDAYFNAKFQDDNPINRWLLLEGLLTDYDAPVVDPTTEDIDDGRTFITNENQKQVTTSIITDEFATLAAHIKSQICREMGWMFEDVNHSLIGHLKSETLFTFRKILENSFFVDTIEPTATTKGRVQLRWTWDETALDTEVDYITQAAMGGYSITKDAVALIDGSIVNLEVSTSGATFRVESAYGGAIEGQRQGLGGLTETTLEAFNEDTQLVVPSTITGDLILGNYTAVFGAAVTGGEFIHFRGVGSDVQKGYDLKDLPDTNDDA